MSTSDSFRPNFHLVLHLVLHFYQLAGTQNCFKVPRYTFPNLIWSQNLKLCVAMHKLCGLIAIYVHFMFKSVKF